MRKVAGGPRNNDRHLTPGIRAIAAERQSSLGLALRASCNVFNRLRSQASGAELNPHVEAQINVGFSVHETNR